MSGSNDILVTKDKSENLSSASEDNEKTYQIAMSLISFKKMVSNTKEDKRLNCLNLIWMHGCIFFKNQKQQVKE